MRRSLSFGLLVALLAVLLVPASSVLAKRATSCHVTNVTTGVGYKAHLQAAIDAAAQGATINIRGTCVGTFVLTKALTLNGKSNGNRGPATLDGGGAGTVLTIHADPYSIGTAIPTVAGLTITGGVATNGGGLNIAVGSRVDIVDSIIVGNTAARGGGVYVAGSSGYTYVHLIGSTVTGNTATQGGGGLYLVNAGWGILERSMVTSNTAPLGGGVLVGPNRGQLIVDSSSRVGGNVATAGIGGGVINGGCCAFSGFSGYSASTFSPPNFPDNCAFWPEFGNSPEVDATDSFLPYCAASEF